MKCFSELASHRPDEGVGDTNTNRLTTELSLSSFIVWAGSHSRSYALIRSCRHQVGGCLSNRPLVTEFVRNFDREDATPYQEVANPLVLVSAVRRKHASRLGDMLGGFAITQSSERISPRRADVSAALTARRTKTTRTTRTTTWTTSTTTTRGRRAGGRQRT